MLIYRNAEEYMARKSLGTPVLNPTPKPRRDEQTVIFCDPDPVLNFENSVQVQP